MNARFLSAASAGLATGVLIASCRRPGVPGWHRPSLLRPLSAARRACRSLLVRAADDDNLWLEDVTGEAALRYVREQNEATVAALGAPEQQVLYGRIKAILDSKEKIPYVTLIEGLYYNFWQDETHQRGLFRRCTLDEYKKTDPAWEVVLDLDALGAAEGESWVWGGYTLLDEGPDSPSDLVILELSRGGADAKVCREFSLATKQFLPEAEGGFVLPEAKSRLSYRSRDVLLVGTDTGPGSLTASGYPRTVRAWQRGTPLASAPVIYEGQASDVAASGYAYYDRGHVYEMASRSLTFWTSEQNLLMNGARCQPRAAVGESTPWGPRPWGSP